MVIVMDLKDLQNMDPFGTLQMIILSEVVPSAYYGILSMYDILSTKMTHASLFFKNETQYPTIHLVLFFNNIKSSHFYITKYIEVCGKYTQWASPLGLNTKQENGDPNPPILCVGIFVICKFKT